MNFDFTKKLLPFHEGFGDSRPLSPLARSRALPVSFFFSCWTIPRAGKPPLSLSLVSLGRILPSPPLSLCQATCNVKSYFYLRALPHTLSRLQTNVHSHQSTHHAHTRTRIHVQKNSPPNSYPHTHTLPHSLPLRAPLPSSTLKHTRSFVLSTTVAYIRGMTRLATSTGAYTETLLEGA